MSKLTEDKRAAMEKSKTKQTNNSLGVRFEKPTIGKTVCLLLILTALTLFIGCSTTETNEPTWNDMYEVRSYQVETITNEIITTVFISTNVETNRVRVLAQPVTDFGGYDFEYIEAPATTSPEFRCLDGSCGIKE